MKLFKSLTILAIILSITVHAQESDNNSIQTDIEEIVVTATSRETNIFEVPYNIGSIPVADTGLFIRRYIRGCF